jgi:hypothetical protein
MASTYLFCILSLSLFLPFQTDNFFLFFFNVFVWDTLFCLFIYLFKYLFIYLFIYLLLIYFHLCAFSLGVSEHQKKLREK